MYPLNKVPSGLFGMLKRFCNYDKIKHLIRHQLIAGAKVALAVAKTHIPKLDLDKIKMGPYSRISGRSVNMKPHYKKATPAAIALADRKSVV